ncbi:RNA polymerase sigma factor SigM [Pseudonocardia abyssalis]|uniref:RNA polymerase sigma factor SigM n=1 Tax=Pseudonocardia abyssalis TaxID=2792008 RepID=A0ABS6UYJ9_9PSEU|nr:RNA polymerase sigma factor SigM [Pseudonocardia abyssalis]MBW0114225.1 RNA polymerase sigma factor SigM [Pseudonocardia abyssalis]MBW0137301.1 RNA polymerase sigma factor SigM [Pseudonocardia abyssalis]
MTTARSDTQLLVAHRDGDPGAFAELVARHTDRMWGVAVQTLADRDAAEDAVQEALLAAHRNAHRFRGDASVRTWLHRILVNACIDRIRREAARRTVPWPSHDVPSRRPDPASELATRMAVADALAELPTEQRLAVVLVDVQGFSVAEVAQILDVPVGTVKSRCARGRTRLARLLGHLREEA